MLRIALPNKGQLSEPLTCDDLDQALDRAGLSGSNEDKGGEALASAVSTLATLRDIGSGQRPYAGFTPS